MNVTAEAVSSNVISVKWDYLRGCSQKRSEEVATEKNDDETWYACIFEHFHDNDNNSSYVDNDSSYVDNDNVSQFHSPVH